MRSIIALNDVQHFQIVASATRLLFELYLDIKALSDDPTNAAAQRYFDFVEIERYRSAEQVVRFASKNPNALRDISPQISYYSDSGRKERVESRLEKGKNDKLIYPEHWTGSTVRERAQQLGFEAWYVETYPVLSWYVHAGATGIGGMTREALESCFGVCHSRVQSIFLDATSICAKEMRISEAIDGFGRLMEDLRLKTGKIITKHLEEAKQKS